MLYMYGSKSDKIMILNLQYTIFGGKCFISQNRERLTCDKKLFMNTSYDTYMFTDGIPLLAAIGVSLYVYEGERKFSLVLAGVYNPPIIPYTPLKNTDGNSYS